MATTSGRSRRIKSTSKPPKSLLCPYCKEILDQPVISTSCGHTFCTACAQFLQNEKKPCPIDNSSFDTSHLVPNRALCSQIEDIEIYCPNGLSLRASCSENEESSSSKDDSVVDVVVDSNGCPEKMKYCELNQHLLVCHFSLVECPEGGSLCGKLRKKELDRHLAGCTQYSCVNKTYGMN